MSDRSWPRGRGGRGARPQRRQPPPDATGREAGAFRAFAESGAPVTVRTVTGEIFRGTVAAFDDDHLELDLEAGAPTPVRIALRAVRSIESD